MMKHFNKAKHLLLLPALLLMAAVSAIAQPLNGTYTVGGATPSYATLTDAVNALNTNGVSGPVTFNLRTGTYSGAQYTIPTITGASATNRVTFQSESGLAANVTVSYAATGSADNFVFTLDNASYVTFKNLTITNTATSTYARAIVLTSAASYDSVASCVFSSTLTSSTSTNAALIYTTSFTGTDNVVYASTFTNGSYGVYLSGSSSSSFANRNIIRSNTFTNQRYRSVYALYANNTSVVSNTFTSSRDGYYGIYCSSSYEVMDISSNSISINNAGSSNLYGIYVTSCGGTSGGYMKVKNNNVTVNNTDYAYVYGIYATSSPYDSVLSNTINVNTMYGNAYPFYNTSSSYSYISANTITGAANYYNAYLYSLNSSSPNSAFVGNTVNITGGTSGYIYHYGIRSGSNNSVMNNNNISLTGRYTYGYTYNYMATDASSPTVRKNNITIVQPGPIYNYLGYYNSSPTIDSNTMTLTSTGTYTYYYLYNYMGYSCNNGMISNNIVNATNNYYVYGMKADYANGVTFSNNKVTATALTTVGYNSYAMFVPYSSNVKLLGNKFTSIAKQYTYAYAYGIYAYNASGIEVTNNTSAGLASYGGYGGDFSYNTNYKIKSNTFYKEGSSYGFILYLYNYQSIGNSIVMNNALLGQGSGYGIYVSSASGQKPTMDYNLYYNSSNTLYDAGVTYTSYNLSGWRALTGEDKNSLIFNALAAFPNRSTGNLTPDPTTPEVWALNGRGVHDVANVPKDINGVNRPVNKPAGVPDLGAYEVSPTSIPPDAVAFPAVPATGMQYFTFGQDTVASIDWTSATVPSTITVKQYSGEAPSSFSFPYYMYFHTDIDVSPGSYPHTANIYYKDPQTGTTAAESGLRLVKRIGTGTWNPYTAPNSSTNATRNVISTTGLTDFGQHTGSDVANNASVSRLVSPTPTFCAPSTQAIKVTVKNTGNNTLNNVKVDWYMNGIFQGTINYNTAINTFLVQPDSVQLTLGNYTFTNAKPVRLLAYSYLPNGVQDAATVDDTLKALITPGLNGEYTIGGLPAPDFVDVKEAIDVLNLWGVCGPTTFNIRDSVGAYQGAGNIKAPIIGGSITNRVTFRSESGNAANVVVQGVDNNPVFGLNNVTDVSIKNITVSALGFTAISIQGSPKRDTIRGCILTAPTTTQADPVKAIISDLSPQYYNGNYAGVDMAIIKNTLSGSSNGISMCAPYSSSAKNNVVDSNTFSSHYYSNIYTYYLNSSKIRGNTFNNVSYTYGYPTYIYYTNTSGTDPIEIIGNTVNISGTGSTYTYNYFGYNTTGTSATRATIAYNKINYNNPNGYFYNYMPSTAYYTDINNNEVNVAANGGYGMYMSYCYLTGSNIFNNVINSSFASSGQGLYMYYLYGGDCKIYNNTFVTSGAGTNYAAQYYMSGSVNFQAYNNIYANFGSAGGALNWYNGGSNNYSDYNNIYSANGQHFSYNGTADTSLDNWRSTRTQEQNSICYNPGLIGMGNMRPNPANPASWSLNGRAIHIADNNMDKDGNPRETDITLGVPDIGAYEFEPTTVPPLAEAIPALPSAGTTQVFTFGQDTVATLAWNPMTIVSNTAEVRQYSGRQGPSYPAGLNHMYFYTDVVTQNVSADYTANLYYKDHWMGTIGTESDLRLLKKLGTNPWVAYNQALSTPDVNRNIITAPHVTSTGLMTGVEDGSLFSAVITPMNSTTFCPGGSALLQANTGMGYTYKWFKNGIEIPGATSSSYAATAAGDYTVQVTDPNATPSPVTATSVAVGVSVIAPPAALITASGPLTYCTGGQLTLMANTGTGLWYQWQFNGNNIPGATADDLDVTSSGNYTVTVNNIGCATTSAITTINQGPLHVTLGDDTSFCESQVLVLDAGYPGAHYMWSTGDTTQKIYITTTSGDYSVFVDAGVNCQARDTINVHVDPLPSVIGISYVSMGGSTFQFAPSGELNTNSYMWLYSDGSVDFNQTTTHTFPANADWIVTLIVFNDCGTDTSVLDLRALDVADVKDAANFNLYPNPANDKVTLSADKVKLSSVLIINNLGQVVYRGTEDNVKSTTIDITGLVDGHYIIRANTSDGKIISKPFDVLK